MTYIAFAEIVLGPFEVVSTEEGFLLADALELPLAVLGDYALLEQGPPGPPTDFRWDFETEAYCLKVDEKALASARAAALAELADRRWRATQTMTYDNVVAPADSALGAVVGFIVGAQVMPARVPVTWKLAQGEFRTWSVEDVTAYGIAIRNHLQACFDVEAAATAAIFSATTPSAVRDALAATADAWPI